MWLHPDRRYLNRHWLSRLRVDDASVWRADHNTDDGGAPLLGRVVDDQRPETTTDT